MAGVPQDPASAAAARVAETEAKPLRELVAALADARPVGSVDGVRVRAVTPHSSQVGPGALFVAVPGSSADGHDFLAEARAAGAIAAVVADADRLPAGMPGVAVPDPRIALAQLAAAWHGHPAERLHLVGITGTVGKTSVLATLEAILQRAGLHTGSVGSLGVRIGDRVEATGYTAPDPLLLHEALGHIADAGVRLALMEATSHAIEQQRIHGLRYALGIFTNLVPLEHADYHSSFREYVAVKSRFLDHLEPGAPLVYSWDDRAVRRLAEQADARTIGCGTSQRAAARVEALEFGRGGTRFVLNVRTALPGTDAAPLRLPVEMKLLGRSNAINAALAATAALCLGAEPGAVADALGALDASRRRMEILHDVDPLVLDDTVGHPDSVSALFEVVERLDARRVHAVFAVRGSRGVRINRRVAESLAIWSARRPLASLVVTTSADAADARNRVSEREREAFVSTLRSAAVPFEEEASLAAAVRRAAGRTRRGDLLLLLGAQGMDAGAEHFRAWLAGRG